MYRDLIRKRPCEQTFVKQALSVTGETLKMWAGDLLETGKDRKRKKHEVCVCDLEQLCGIQ